MEKYYAGAISGIIEVGITHPLDYIKTKRQEFIQNNIKINNFYKKIINGNILNLYSGIFSRMIGVIPMRLSFWGVQGSVKDYLEQHKVKSKFNFMLIGSSGGGIQSLIDNQIEIIKINQMTGKKINVKKIIKFEGLAPTLYRNVGFANCVAFSCFNINHKNNMEKFYYSAFAGLIGSVITQPLDYVKTIKHKSEPTYFNGKDIKNLNTFQILKVVYKHKPLNLFTGVLARSGLSFFTMGIGFVAYDKINDMLQ
jgi:hypothetical protein